MLTYLEGHYPVYHNLLCSECDKYVSLNNLCNRYYYSHLTDEETRSGKLSGMPDIAQLVNGGGKIGT